MPGCHFPFCLNNPELCTFWSGLCLSQVTFANGDPHVWGTQLSVSFPYGQAGISSLCVNQEAGLQQVEIWLYWIYREGTGPSPSTGVPAWWRQWRNTAQYPTVSHATPRSLFRGENQENLKSTGLCALTLKCFHWHALAQGCLGKLTPDLCGKQPAVALPELRSSWTTLQGLRDVEDEDPSWTGLIWKEPTPFLHHHHSFSCVSVSVAVAIKKELCSLLRRKEVNSFPKMWHLEKLSLQSRGSKLYVFLWSYPS